MLLLSLKKAVDSFVIAIGSLLIVWELKFYQAQEMTRDSRNKGNLITITYTENWRNDVY